jgi:hypothetical protein
VAAKADDNDGWQETGRSGGGGGATVWKTTAAEATRQMVGGGGATMMLSTTTKKQQSTNKQQQRWRIMRAGERRGVVVEAEERLLCGGGGLHGKVMEDGGRRWVGGRARREVHNFLFLYGVESYLQSYPLQSYQKYGVIFGICDPIIATIEVGFEKVGLGSQSLKFLGYPTPNPTLNPTLILSKKLLGLWALIQKQWQKLAF